MSAFPTNSETYVALRARRDTDVEAWWSAARGRRDIPYPVGALLSGRSRVEVTRAEADEALAWAGSVDGWSGAPRKPLYVHHLGDPAAH